jgi:uncharacterized membrane protein YraQ (UPF0718 family)
MFYRRRYGTFLRKNGVQGSPLKRGLAKSEISGAVFVCAALLWWVAGPVIAPASAFTAWARQPYSLLIYAVWCWFIATAISIAPKVLKLLRKNGRHPHEGSDA